MSVRLSRKLALKSLVEYFICVVSSPENKIYSIFDQEASKIVSDELRRDWNRKNIYPLDECTMGKK